ncbi:hypothetical protein [Thermocatellispora tengchongensis]|uniref:hypothetical protein n=1 Tax=Thermocatellispora tengchongensis TaxID=1073253 RepID=UPI003629DDAD
MISPRILRADWPTLRRGSGPATAPPGRTGFRHCGGLRLMRMPAFHERLVSVLLPLYEAYGLVLAGGYAMKAHGFLDRPGDDLAFATGRSRPRSPRSPTVWPTRSGQTVWRSPCRR